jgi:hypothetical protein
MSMSSADSPQPISPTPRVPSGPVRLVKALYNPTYLAILASVGIHGLAVASLPIVGPMVSGGQQTPQGPRETKILKLTPAEANRLRSAFPAPKTTVLPPGLPSFNPNSTSSQSFSPPPLSGDLSQSKSGRGWASIFGGNPSSETSEAADDSSRVASTWYNGESEGTSGESYDDSGESGAATRNGYYYPPEGYPDFSGRVGSPPPFNDRATTDQTPAKPRLDQQAANNGRKPNTPAQNRDTGNTQGNDNNPDSPDAELAALVNSATDLGLIPGMRTGQTAFQALEGTYPGLVVRNPDGTVSFAYLGNDSIVEAAIQYTLQKNPSAIPLEPGSYRYDFVYGSPESETTSDVAEDNPTSPTEIASDNPGLLALQAAYPDYETLPFQPIELSSEVSATAQVAVTIDAEGNPKPILIQPTGNPDLDQRALEEAQSLLDRSSVGTIQTFEIQFGSPDTAQPETETPKPQLSPPPLSPNPETTPEASEESTSEPIPKPSPEASEESTSEPIPKPSPEASEESTSEPIPKPDETLPPKTPLESQPSTENTEEESTEETPIESSPEVHPKKQPLEQQSALPSF